MSPVFICWGATWRHATKGNIRLEANCSLSIMNAPVSVSYSPKWHTGEYALSLTACNAVAGATFCLLSKKFMCNLEEGGLIWFTRIHHLSNCPLCRTWKSDKALNIFCLKLWDFLPAFDKLSSSFLLPFSQKLWKKLQTFELQNAQLHFCPTLW